MIPLYRDNNVEPELPRAHSQVTEPEIKSSLPDSKPVCS